MPAPSCRSISCLSATICLCSDFNFSSTELKYSFSSLIIVLYIYSRPSNIFCVYCRAPVCTSLAVSLAFPFSSSAAFCASFTMESARIFASATISLSSIITPASLAASFTIRSARAFASAMMDSLDFIIWRLSASSFGRRVRTSSSIANSSSRFILIILPLLKTPAVLQLSTYTSISSINSSILIFAILFLPYRS